MASTELKIVESTEIVISRPFEVPKLPPHPVFDDHIEKFLQQTSFFAECKTAADFEFAKTVATAGARLRLQIKNSYAELKRAIDDVKAPVLDDERRDNNRVENEVKRIDLLAIAWNKEQQRVAQEAAEARERERVAKEKADREAEAKMARMWEDDEAAKTIESKPPPETRPFTADSGSSYRRGARKETWKATIVKPDDVKRQYCDPSQSRISITVNGYFHLLKNPTPEQIKECEDKIGGVKIALG